ncbi:MAG: hypothetical protein ACRD9R_02030 [Pyrinomonadaceae bacterium]
MNLLAPLAISRFLAGAGGVLFPFLAGATALLFALAGLCAALAGAFELVAVGAMRPFTLAALAAGEAAFFTLDLGAAGTPLPAVEPDLALTAFSAGAFFPPDVFEMDFGLACLVFSLRFFAGTVDGALRVAGRADSFFMPLMTGSLMRTTRYQNDPPMMTGSQKHRQLNTARGINQRSSGVCRHTAGPLRSVSH